MSEQNVRAQHPARVNGNIVQIQAQPIEVPVPDEQFRILAEALQNARAQIRYAPAPAVDIQPQEPVVPIDLEARLRAPRQLGAFPPRRGAIGALIAQQEQRNQMDRP